MQDDFVMKNECEHGEKSGHQPTLLSLFDGSGGFPLAASMCGIRPVACSEVEPYPIAVTKSRLPAMKHLGSVTDLHGGEMEPVDIITLGSPCQDMSVAGKRAGLKHTSNGDDETTRSGLFIEAIRIIKEMREKTHGIYPAIVLWENVAGAFSSNHGRDFRTVLEEFIKIVEPSAVMPAVPAKGWARADCYVGDGWSLAYRTFDAQYWGVPQRRKRIYLVLDLRGERAKQILFEREGLRGNFTKGSKTRQATSIDTQTGSGTANSEKSSVPEVTPIDMMTYDFGKSGNPQFAIVARHPNAVAYPFKSYDGCENEGKESPKTQSCDTPSCINNQVCFDSYAFGICAMSSNSMKSNNPNSGFYLAETARTLDGNGGNPCCNQGGIAVVSVQGSMIGRSDKNGPQGSGISDGPCFTLNTVDHHAVAYGIESSAGADTHTLGQPACTYKCYDARGNENGDIAGTITGDHEARITDYTNVLYYQITEQNPSIQYIVRRLTPIECARLQGFPDDWGVPDKKEKFTKEEYLFWLDVRNTHAKINGKTEKAYSIEQMLKWYNRLHSDASEYKMWGNGIALPNALYCMEGIADALCTRL